MTKKTPPAVAAVAKRHQIWMAWKLIIPSVSLCLFALLRLQFFCDSYSSPAIHRSRSPITRRANLEFAGPPKIAFLFLVRQYLPLDFLWGPFFENADVANFSIYIHSSPGFKFDESTTRSHFFYGRQLNNSIQVVWGDLSVIQAERLLLSAALDNPANQRFVLLSESCVPLYNFSYIYSYIMASSKSFVDSFLDTKEPRYNQKMSPIIQKHKWRKGSQWITLIRSHAEVIMNDGVIFHVYQKYCKRNNCVPDEHYVQTLFSIAGLEGELERRGLTYTMWNLSVTRMGSTGWHPITFTYANACPKKIKAIDHVYYETEYRTEWCQTNSTLVPCFLFARKFSKGAGMRLLSEGLVSPFDASTLLTT